MLPKTMRPSANNQVRRRLFADDDPTEQAKNDNFANMLQESVERDREEKMRRWNFDFKNDQPLEGVYEWYRSDGVNDWIGIKSDTKIYATDTGIRHDIYETDTRISHDIYESETRMSEYIDSMENDQLLIKLANEATPRTNIDKNMPLIRKRRKSADCPAVVIGARRKISFD